MKISGYAASSLEVYVYLPVYLHSGPHFQLRHQRAPGLCRVLVSPTVANGTLRFLLGSRFRGVLISSVDGAILTIPIVAIGPATVLATTAVVSVASVISRLVALVVAITTRLATLIVLVIIAATTVVPTVITTAFTTIIVAPVVATVVVPTVVSAVAVGAVV